MRLTALIDAHREELLEDFEDFARTYTQPGEGMDVAGLRDHADGILDAIILDLGEPQTASEQERKSKGAAARPEDAPISAAERHGIHRAADAFSLRETFAEFRALRASVLRVWARSGMATADEPALDEMIRFNEAVDQALAESIDGYAGQLQRLEEERDEEEGRISDEVRRAKTDFLQMISHELRAPLHAIGGYNELLAMEIRGPLTEAQQDVLRRMKHAEEHLLGIIEGILGFQNSGQPLTAELVEVTVGAALEDLWPLVEPKARSHDVSLENHLDGAAGARVWADPERLRQVLLNLVSNAIHFTPEGGRVWLDYVDTPDEGCMRVHDTGVGIPPDQLEAIFEPFTQLDMSLTRERGGIGLGLAISRQLAHGMRGSITVTSRLGRGSTFTLSLPKQRP